MSFDKATKSFSGLKAENVLLKAGAGALLLACTFFVAVEATRDEAVVLLPPFQHEQIEFINGRANQDYYQQWAWSTAMMMGNLTGGNAQFIRGEIERIATPQLYRGINDFVTAELQAIIRDKAAVTFSPRDVKYDPELDLFFVSGVQSIQGPGANDPITNKVVYELGFTTKRLRIFLDRFDVYQGTPRTSEIREDILNELAAEEREREQKSLEGQLQ